MYWELFIAIIGISLLIIFINITDCFIKFTGLIKGGKILEYFPSWGGTKKPLLWYIIWSIVEFLDLPLFIVVAVLNGSTEYLLVSFLLTVPTYIILYEIIYVIATYIQKQIINKNY